MGSTFASILLLGMKMSINQSTSLKDCDISAALALHDIGLTSGSLRAR